MVATLAIGIRPWVMSVTSSLVTSVSALLSPEAASMPSTSATLLADSAWPCMLPPVSPSWRSLIRRCAVIVPPLMRLLISGKTPDPDEIEVSTCTALSTCHAPDVMAVLTSVIETE